MSEEQDSRPLGGLRQLLSNSYATLVSRLVLGGVLVASGATKIPDPGAFAAAIRSYGLNLPEGFVSFSAYALPYAEVFIGLYLIAGLFSRPAAWASNALMVVFLFALFQGAVRGLEINCGCFGTGQEASNPWLAILRDLGLLALGLHVALLGAGRFSVDALLSRGRARETSEVSEA
ncbi:putative membrane protein [Rubrobacter radiotolerans]|uniref:MauE/DoxX family redox-associated membrane protein n=1 Tax=Rubrobacter radiotolerans TaxID=42256 RepID=A0A023WYL4_RUBRA|nr:MauE/DoxX family redox-associated membrane protein [Rubrobacter radiotolerans]AHY45317.1 putative membrane protein [Rubrobacter radiotolerans]MDX5892729.1 MauE/DoxX family redox-associated membrane protein [Rubrobacter radiotolerans]SMC02368.1 Uncharacterized membrane protein YphA, DoxX/SURF4 family [Rubrobacter radiotolerans DSM 5868]